MLLGIAIGDAFGAGYEFAFKDRKDYQNVDLSRYSANPNPDFRHQEGIYTDDTQMSIAIAELLADDVPFTSENLADYFLRTYKRDPKVGYAKGFQALLNSISTKEEFLSQIKSDSERNGAAMRSIPIGIIPDLEKVVEYAKINAKLTHNTPKGISSSIIIASAAHFQIYGYPVNNIISKEIDTETLGYITRILKMKHFDPILLFGEKNKDKGVPCNAMRTIGAVIYLLDRQYHYLKDILAEAVKLGGDTDSVTSISLGLTMIKRQVSELPAHFYDHLTNDKYGRDYLIALGDRLAKRFKINS